jgi:hypothetical protein
MIPKSVQRFSEKIMLKQETKRDGDSRKSHPVLARAGATPNGARTGLQTHRYASRAHPMMVEPSEIRRARF